MKNIRNLAIVMFLSILGITQIDKIFGNETSGNPTPYYIETTYEVPTSIDDGGDFVNFWTAPAAISTLVMPDGGVTVSVADGTNVHLYEYDVNMQLQNEITIPYMMELFGAIEVDADGNYYIFYGEEVADGDKRTENLTLAKYDNDGNLIASDSFAVNSTTPGGMSGVKIPFNTSGCDMAISGDYLYVSFGREMHETADGLSHQGSYGVVYDINTMEQVTTDTAWNSPWMSHVMEQYIIPIEDGFALLQVGDSQPRAFLLSEVTSSGLEAKEVMQIAGEEGNNYVYSEIGGIEQTSSGDYIIVGTYEQAATDNNDQSDKHVDSRNIFYQVVSSDLQTISEPVYLTNYTDAYTENAANISMVKTGQDEFTILWEKMEYTGSGGDVHYGEYQGTYIMQINSQGQVLIPETQLPDVRLNMYSHAVYNPVTDSVLWSVNEGTNGLVTYEIDMSKPLDAGLYEVVVTTQAPNGEPLSGATVTYNGQPFTTNGSTHSLHLPLGSHTIEGSMEGYTTEAIEVNVIGSPTEVVLTLEGAAFNYTVKDAETAEYLSGVTITLADGTVVKEEFRNDGWYSYISSVPTGIYTATFEKEGYITRTYTAEMEAGYTNYKVVSMENDTNVRFEVNDENGNPINNFTMYFDGNTTPYSTTTGTLLMPNFAAGHHEVTVEVDGYTPVTKSIYIDTTNQLVTIDMDDNVAVTGITLDANSATLTPDATKQLNASITPSNATNQNITWSSDDEAVATVDENGLVTAIKPGNATITATTEDGGFIATCDVTVIEETYSVTYDANFPVSGTGSVPIDVNEYNEGDLVTIAENPGNLTAPNNKFIGWSLTPDNLNPISTMTMPGNDVVLYGVWEQDIAVTGITLDANSATLTPGATKQLNASITPSNATNQNITWSSDNEDVATVDENGLVTAIKPGNATITATTEDGGFIATCDVTVIEETYSVTYDANFPVSGTGSVPIDANEYNEGDLVTIAENPGNLAAPDYKFIGWSLTPDNLNPISTMTMPANDVVLYGVWEANVTNVPVTGINIDSDSLSMHVGDIATLTVSIEPSNATNQDVTWTSSDETIATIDQNGKVTAINEGSAIITVTSNDGSFTANCNVDVVAEVSSTPPSEGNGEDNWLPTPPWQDNSEDNSQNNADLVNENQEQTNENQANDEIALESNTNEEQQEEPSNEAQVEDAQQTTVNEPLITLGAHLLLRRLVIILILIYVIIKVVKK